MTARPAFHEFINRAGHWQTVASARRTVLAHTRPTKWTPRRGQVRTSQRSKYGILPRFGYMLHPSNPQLTMALVPLPRPEFVAGGAVGMISGPQCYPLPSASRHAASM